MKYLITLKPLDKFFFGGEITSGASGNKNYFIKSNSFPQQTAVLGMMRKEVLIQSGIFRSDGKYSSDESSRIAGFIGDKSFDIGSEKAQDFGVIKRISPVFIKNNESVFFSAPKYYLEDKSEVVLGDETIETNLSQNKVLLLKDYDPKRSFYNGFIDVYSKNLIGFNEVFKEDESVGIDKNNSDEAFYKQVYYRLHNGCHFAFYLDLDGSFDLKDSIVQLGAETSSFKMTVEKIDKLSKHTLSDNKRLVLLSDAYVDMSIYEECGFAITDTVDFRTATFNNEYKFSGKSSVKCTFLKRGSVLFSDRTEEVKAALLHQNLLKIGYNIIEMEG